MTQGAKKHQQEGILTVCFRKKKTEYIRRWKKNNPEKVRAQKRRNYHRRKERERRERDD